MKGYYILLSSRWPGDLVSGHRQSTTLLMQWNSTQLAALITLSISVWENRCLKRKFSSAFLREPWRGSHLKMCVEEVSARNMRNGDTPIIPLSSFPGPKEGGTTFREGQFEPLLYWYWPWVWQWPRLFSLSFGLRRDLRQKWAWLPWPASVSVWNRQLPNWCYTKDPSF